MPALIPDPPDPRIVLGRMPVGRRVVVRRLIEDGARATDALGELVARDRDSVTVRTRRGTVRIALDEVVIAKEVPPDSAGVWRIPRFLRRARVAVLDLGCLRLSGYAVPSPAGSTASPTLALALVEELVSAGTPTFILTHGTDGPDEELTGRGLPHLIPLVVEVEELADPEPDHEWYARAHAEIERRLGRPVGRGEVHFTDARPAHIDAARGFGWQSRVFTLPPAPPDAT